MKKWMKALSVLTVVSLLFVGCVEPKAEETVYTLTVDKESLPIDVDTTDTITVTTNGTFTAVSDDTAVATVSTSVNVVTVTGVSKGSATITITCTEKPTLTLDVPVEVSAVEMTLTLDYSALTAAANVASATVYYGNAEDSENTTATATVNTQAKTASVILDQSYANAWDWYNGVVITLKDASDNVIEAGWVYESAPTNENAGSFTFKADGITLTAADPAEKFGTLTLTFSGFTIPGGSITVNYGAAQNGTYVNATDSAVAQDGASATVTVSNQYANSSGWFNGVTITVLDSTSTAVTGFTFDNYFEFAEAGMALTLTKDSATWTKLVDALSYIADDNSKTIAESSAFTGITPTQIKIEAANVTGSVSWWFWVSSTADWDTGADLKDDSSISGRSLTITDATIITAITTNGLLLKGPTGLTATVTVSYLQ